LSLISVIVPVYKVEPYLSRCIDSVLAQTFTDFELILVDDGSPDNCPAICDEYSLKDKRVYVLHQTNKGLSAARNAGLDFVLTSSESEWISFVDSDDWVHHQYLERLLRASNECSTSISVCKHIRSNGSIEDIDIKEDKQPPIVITPKELYLDHFTYANIACGKLYKKRLFSNIRFPLGKVHEDMFVTYRLLFSNERIAFIDFPLYFYFYNVNGITQSDWTPNRLDAFYAWENQIEFFKSIQEPELTRQTVYRCMRGYISHIESTKNSTELSKIEKIRYQILLNGDFKKKVIKYRLLLKKDNGWNYFFQKAFPKTNWVYWTMMGIGNKIKRVLQKK